MKLTFTAGEKLVRDTKLRGPCITDGCLNTFEWKFVQVYDKRLLTCRACTLKLKKKPTFRYNQDTLDELSEELGVEFGFEGESLNVFSPIYNFCITDGCWNVKVTSFQCLLKNKKLHCDVCVEVNRILEVHTRFIGPLEDLMKKASIELWYDGDMLNGHTMIQGVCVKDGCNAVFSRRIDYLLKAETLTCDTHCKEDAPIKHAATSHKNWGVSNPTKSPIVQQRQQDTFQKNYGYKTSLLHPDVKAKADATNELLYGHKCSLVNPEIKEKALVTMKQRYGARYAMQTEELRKKQQETMFQRHGVHFAFQSDELYQRAVSTWIDKYGVSNPSQDPGVAEKQVKSAFKRKTFVYPSGHQETVQGYEPLTLATLVESGFDETMIITSRKDVPVIWWEDSDGVQHRYYIDIFIPMFNLMIEVKSVWTYQLAGDKLKKTRKVCEGMGYQFRVWVYNDKKQLIRVE